MWYTDVAKINFLFKSRHGVYYFRAIIPIAVRTALSLTQRELRVSLRTKDKYKAKSILYKKSIVMNLYLNSPAPWEVDSERRKALYLRGIELIKQYGMADLDDEFELGILTDEVNGFDLEAYLLALDHIQAKKRRKFEKVEARTASMSDAAVTTRSPAPPKVPLLLSVPDDTNHAIAGGAPLSNDGDAEEALNRFVNAKRLNTRASTAEKYRDHIRLFFKIIFDGSPSTLRMSDITLNEIRCYADILPKCPPKIRLNDPRPISQIIQGAQKRLAPKTRFSHAQAVNMFLTFCQDQQYPTPAQFGGVLKPLLKKPSINKLDQNKLAFTDAELRLVFLSNNYRNGTFKRPSDYWVPLLGLFTGARQGEICQIRVKDVRQDVTTGVWMLDINEEDDNQLKNGASIRQVPLHSKLIDLGWLDFVKEARIRRLTRLFPDERRSKKGEFSGFSKRFGRYLQNCVVPPAAGKRKNFHSLRHAMQHKLYGLGCEEYVVKALTGHSLSNNGEGLKTYAPGPLFAAKHETLCRLEYDLDFSVIKPNGWGQKS